MLHSSIIKRFVWVEATCDYQDWQTILGMFCTCKHCFVLRQINSINPFKMEAISSVLPQNALNELRVITLCPKSTAMVMAGGSVHITTLFPGQAWTSS